MGKMVEVEIYETGKHFLKGKIMKNTEIKSPGLTNPLPKGEVSGADVNNINVCSEVRTQRNCLKAQGCYLFPVSDWLHISAE